MAEIPTADWTWIDAAADRFERGWKQGHGRGSRTSWPRSDESRWPLLLEELLARRARASPASGEDPRREEYSPPLPAARRAHRGRLRPRTGPSPTRPGPHPTRRPRTVATDGQADDNGDPAPGTRMRYFGDYELIQASSAAAAWASSTRPARSASTGPSRCKMIRSAALASEDEMRRFQQRGRGRRAARPPAHRADLRGRRTRRPALLLA